MPVNARSITIAAAIVASALTAGSVREVAGDLATAFTNKLGSQLLRSLTSSLNGLTRREPDRLNKTYARLLGRIFIDPLVDPGTNASSRLFSWTPDVGQQSAAGVTGQLGDFVIAAPNRPFLIANGTIIVARRDYEYPLLMPIEYTPMYVGVRRKFSDRFGGMYVSPWAYDSVRIGEVDADGYRLQVQYDPARNFTLADVVASTGAAPQLALVLGNFVPDAFKARIQQVSALFPAFRHIALNDGAGVRNLLSDEIGHGDGGFSENLGVMPLLARGVKKIIVFINTNTEYVENNDDLKALFFPIGPPGAAGDKTRNRVFWCRDDKAICDDADRDTYYRTLIDALRARRGAKKPQVYCAGPWKVLKNDHYNVAAYETGVSVCWFYNSAAQAWEQALPYPLREMALGHDQTPEGKNFDHFPWLSTFYQNKMNVIQLTTPQVNLLSNLTAWIVSDAQTREMLAKTLRLDTSNR